MPREHILTSPTPVSASLWPTLPERASFARQYRNTEMAKAAKAAGIATGQCLCGSISFEIDVPARWAWHDHSAASRRAHGAAYATYVGIWRKRFRTIKVSAAVARYEEPATQTVRSSRTRCGP